MGLKKNKKGQVFDQLAQLGVGIAGFAIVIIVAFLIMSQGNTQAENLVSASSATNESVAGGNSSNNTNIAFTNTGAFSLSCSEVRNNVSEVIGAGNYTCSTAGLLIVIGPQSDYDLYSITPELFADYSYKLPSSAVNATREMQNATDTIPSWIPLIIIAIIGSILLGIVALFKRAS